MSKPTDIIKKPLITEKASLVKENGWYVFSVLTSSNKNQIRDAVEKLLAFVHAVGLFLLAFPKQGGNDAGEDDDGEKFKHDGCPFENCARRW